MRRLAEQRGNVQETLDAESHFAFNRAAPPFARPVFGGGWRSAQQRPIDVASRPTAPMPVANVRIDGAAVVLSPSFLATVRAQRPPWERFLKTQRRTDVIVSSLRNGLGWAEMSPKRRRPWYDRCRRARPSLHRRKAGRSGGGARDHIYIVRLLPIPHTPPRQPAAALCRRSCGRR